MEPDCGARGAEKGKEEGEEGSGSHSDPEIVGSDPEKADPWEGVRGMPWHVKSSACCPASLLCTACFLSSHCQHVLYQYCIFLSRLRT